MNVIVLKNQYEQLVAILIKDGVFDFRTGANTMGQILKLKGVSKKDVMFLEGYRTLDEKEKEAVLYEL